MYNERFNLSILSAKEKRLIADITAKEKKLEQLKVLLNKVQWEKISQEYKLNKLVNLEP